MNHRSFFVIAQIVKLEGMKKLDISARLKKLRYDRDLSQAKMAESIGVSTRFYQAIEKGDKQPSIETLVKASEGLNVPIEALLSGAEQTVSIEPLLETIRLQELKIRELQIARLKIIPGVVDFFSSIPKEKQLQILGIVRATEENRLESLDRLRSPSRPSKSRLRK